MSKINTLYEAPRYNAHRREAAAGGVPADTAVLADLYAIKDRASINCAGYKAVKGFVVLTGGTNPSVSLIPLERTKHLNASGAEVTTFRELGPAISGLIDQQMFEVEVDGAQVFMRLSAVTGAPTAVEIMLTGIKNALETTQ